jgi:TolA-binding protein
MRLALSILLLAGVAAPALAQSSDLPARVDRLDSQVRALQRKVFPGGNPQYFDPQIAPPTQAPVADGAPAQSVVSDLTQRVSALEQQISTLTNQSEVNGHRLDVLEQNMAKMKGDTDYRLNALEGHGAPAPGPAASQDNGAAPPPVPLLPPPAGSATDNTDSPPAFGPAGRRPPGDSTMAAQATPDAGPPPVAMPPKTGDPAEDGYMAGYALWMQKRYSDAETQLKQVVAKYPDSRRASYAQNLLGRAYLDDGQPAAAAEAFLASYKKFPRGERAPDSLYYLGVTLTQLKKNSQACQVFDEFRDVYGPTANATLKGRVAQGRVDAHCGN